MLHTLSPLELKRYSRHLILPEVGLSGQQKLKDASVLCVGAGGLGSPLATYLAAAGVGRIGVVDNDVVDYSNLQRQILYRTDEVGQRKAQAARERLSQQNPEIEIIAHETMLTSENAFDICKDYDVIADGTDNFPTRYLINDTCVFLSKPNVHASIFRFEGRISVFGATGGPCYRCLYPEPPQAGEIPSCAEGGVLGVMPGLLGIAQATEVLKLILGIGAPLVGRLMVVDALEMRTHELRLAKNPKCPVCGTHPTIRELRDYHVEFGYCEAVAPAVSEITPGELNALLNNPAQRITVLDVRERPEWDICRIDGATHIPASELPDRLHELNAASDIIVYCLMGGRSRKAIGLLQDAGFTRLRNLSGGIRAWAETVDSTLPIY